jgi:hypothetical protein
MDKIQELLAKLKKGISPALKRRVDGLATLNQKFELAKKENEDNPSEDNQEAFDGIKEYVEETTDDLIADLQALVDKEAETPPAPAPTTPPAPVVETVVEPKKEEGSGLGFFGILVGVGLLVVSAGVINTLNKK